MVRSGTLLRVLYLQWVPGKQMNMIPPTSAVGCTHTLNSTYSGHLSKPRATCTLHLPGLYTHHQDQDSLVGPVMDVVSAGAPAHVIPEGSRMAGPTGATGAAACHILALRHMSSASPNTQRPCHAEQTSSRKVVVRVSSCILCFRLLRPVTNITRFLQPIDTCILIDWHPERSLAWSGTLPPLRTTHILVPTIPVGFHSDRPLLPSTDALFVINNCVFVPSIYQRSHGFDSRDTYGFRG
jgi:hypothetical protein